MRFLKFETERCVVTGNEAKVFTGHVVGYVLCVKGFERVELVIIAGFASIEVLEGFEFRQEGFAGEWKPEYGIRLRTSYECEY